MMYFSSRIKSRRCITLIVVIALIAGALPSAVFALSVDKAYTETADLLVLRQYLTGEWVGQENFTGSIVAGLIRAYEATDNAGYLAAAEKGAGYILDVAGGNYFGDEAYALARLGEVTGEQSYTDAVRVFYKAIDTDAYISGFSETDRSNAVFYVAHHTIAAHKVGAPDAETWRKGLIECLCLIDDDMADYPVMSLGAAVWALAQTGSLDDALMDSDGKGESYWTDVKLSELPDLLAAHLDLSGDHRNSFYYRFDHNPAGPGFEASGYTEDTIFGLLGLMAADAAGWDFEQEIVDAREKLTGAVTPGGFVWAHVDLHYGHTPTYWVYGGELLETMETEDLNPVLLGSSAVTQDN